MSSKMTALEREGQWYEDRWKRSIRDDNAGEAYSAVEDYKRNIAAREEELKKMDPNSREYEKAEMKIDEQKSKLWDMNYEQNRKFSHQDLSNEVENLNAKNMDISNKMSKAVENGDTRTYDTLKAQYNKNIAMQEQMGKRLKEDGFEFKANPNQQRRDILDHDIDMRDKLSEKIAKQTEKGKQVSEEDKKALEKYSNNVKQGEIDLVKKQNQQKIDSMRERGVSEQQIKYQQEDNKESEKWVESINR